MKLNGHKIEGPNRDFIVIPRGNNKDIVLHVQAVLDMDQFEQMCPTPRPPMRKMKGGLDVPNLNDSAFRKACERHVEQRLMWMVLKSLEATPELEWELVDIGDSSTWLNMRKELREAGFSDVEINRIINAAYGVNSLNEAKIQAARDRFLLSREEQQNELSSQTEELSITQSGEPVSASE